MTSRTLEEIGADYRIVIEPQEYDAYAAVIDPKKILVLPFSNLGQGGIPARNWVWEHSISEGHKRHWILDDNIRYLYRLHKNSKLRVRSTAPFRVCEDFTDRFENVKMSGLNYHYFTPSFVKKAPYYLNTRIYSCILLDNSVEHRWRGRYNEDTDLSLRILKDGNCTVLLNQFTCGKAATLTMKGGNTEEIYKLGNTQEFDNRYTFAKSLYDQHPDVVEITQKWGRWHHSVDYSSFQRNNKLKLRADAKISRDPNAYGLKLVKLSNEDDITSKYTVLNTDNYLEAEFGVK
jgi:hypothetical protein